MKLIKRSCLCLILGGLLGISFALHEKAQPIVNAVDLKLEKMTTVSEKVEFLSSFINILDNPYYLEDTYSYIFKEIKQYCEQKKDKLQNANNIKTGLEIANVDLQKVRDTILSWHNTERTKEGLQEYRYQPYFEKSATKWVKTIVSEGRSSNFHQRKKSDGYYSYASILDRFADLGITFPVLWGGKTSFSESVGYGYYECKKSDCTDELIKSLKTTRDGLIMKEKNTKGSHYRAATMAHFTDMGIGIEIQPSQKRYYVVLHYGVEPQS